jgi:hypothetical protein
MVEHERRSLRPQRSHRPLAVRIRFAPDLLQGVAAEDAAPITALLASGPRLRRVLEAPSFQDSGVRAARCAPGAGGSSHAYIFAAVACAQVRSQVRSGDPTPPDGALRPGQSSRNHVV